MKWYICLVYFTGYITCANILTVFPTISKSHFVIFDVLIKELVKRGHSVTSVTTFPQNVPVDNFTNICVGDVKKVLFNNLKFQEVSGTPPSKFLDVFHLFLQDIESTQKILNSPKVSDLISSNSTFDLLIYEMFIDDVFLGFAHKFKVPVIAISSCYMYPWVSDRFAIPANPAYVPGFFSHIGKTMNFSERFQNTLLNLICKLFNKYYLEPTSTDILRKYFGPSIAPVHELVKHVSLYFINTHFSFFGAEPFPPQVVDVSGIHLKPPKHLPQELDKWMNESKDGVIYFSFGSMLRGSTLPQDKVKAFLQVFATLPQRVLWKWEDDAVNELPANVKIMKWLPQRDVLAHPKVKVFISHGGLLGTTEAVVSGIPILGIPMYGDQPNNVAALVENRVAVHIDYNNISVNSLSYALNTLLYDKSYSENAKLLSRRFLDRPQSPLETAVYWTEYVIRHRGAPHLQSAAVHLPWYQYYLLDVAAVCLAAVLVTLSLIYYIVRFCLRLLISTKSTKSATVCLAPQATFMTRTSISPGQSTTNGTA